VKEALLVKYFGVYAPPPTQGLVTASSAERGEELTYKIVRPSTVTATLTSPNGTPTVLESQAAKEPGVYKFGWSTFDAEGTWRFDVLAVDDLGRQSTIQRTFQYDLTLSSLRVPRSAKQKQGLAVAFTLSRTARVALRIETKLGTTVKALPAVQLGAGESTLRWDGKITARTPAFPGSYVARVLATSEVGKMDASAPFTLRK
jgi:hypothetical protein